MIRPDDMSTQVVYWRFGRIDFAKGNRGWWITLWRCHPPAKDQRYRSLGEVWYRNRLRVVRRIMVLP